jgi:putative ABC transport system substrate-binding protein
MNRRAFIITMGGGLLAAPLAGEAQQAKKPYKIGYLSPNLSQPRQSTLQSFLQGLHDRGYVEGRDFVMEYRFAEGEQNRLPELAADLVRERVDVIVTFGTPATKAAKEATQTIPIVFSAAGGAVVMMGIVQSLARPGGNVTGLLLQLSQSKAIQLVKDAVPTVTSVVLLHDPTTRPGEILGTFQKSLYSQAKAQNVELQIVAVSDPAGILHAFAEFKQSTNGLVIDAASVLGLKADQICRLALQRRLPTTGYGRVFAHAGCLMSYGEDLGDMSRRAAGYVDKILKGAKPADLPVEQATKFELVINLKTAKALGLTIPPSLLQRADEIIE